MTQREMSRLLEPLQAVSLKEVFIERFEDLILSGALKIGEKLPSERALAVQLGVSRPVVHEGLVELSARGLVTIKPRVGTVVNDYRREGSLALLSSLLSHGEGALHPDLLRALLDLRRLLETETARLAAHERTDEDLVGLRAVLAEEVAADPRDTEHIVALDFQLHHRVALASGNPLYAMLLRSCEPAHRNFGARFFRVPGACAFVFERHRALVDAIAGRDAGRAGELMAELLAHGRQLLDEALAAEPATEHTNTP